MILTLKCTSCFGFYHVLIETDCLLVMLEYEIEIIKLRSMEYYLIVALDYAMIRYCSLSLDFAMIIWNYVCSAEDSNLRLGDESSIRFRKRLMSTSALPIGFGLCPWYDTAHSLWTLPWPYEIMSALPRIATYISEKVPYVFGKY